ncbi:MAG: hypothetical protein BWZ08_00695 [candidate division BRC1 bacterium ADurb.BinA292]|nr:MAG: hypothetical protein BWZ08_00695 [candidate division BRC1 bacterium ADurb.BinA292]
MIYLDAVLGLILVILLAGAFGRYPLWRLALEALVGLAMIVAIHALAAILWRWLANYLDEGATPPSRRRMGSTFARKTRRETRFEALDDQELERHLERHPDDALALESHCERLWAAGRRDDYARELSWLLNLPNRMSIDEQVTRLHWLADYHLRENGRPGQAIEALRLIEARFPGTYQATLARQRILSLRTALAEGEKAGS